jgi:hypothetical protein
MFLSYEPKLEDIMPDTSGWEESEHQHNLIRWYTDRDAFCRLFLDGPCNWPFDLTSLDGAQDFYGRQSIELGGAMVEIDIERLQGIETLSGVFKYRYPVPGSLAMYYVGIFWFPFERNMFQINFEAVERGTTGEREAAVYMVDRQSWSGIDKEPTYVASMEEMFQKMREAKVIRVPSDDKKYDASFPNHPLSLVRALMAEFRATGYINPKLKEQRLFRLKK